MFHTRKYQQDILKNKITKFICKGCNKINIFFFRVQIAKTIQICGKIQIIK